MCVCVCVCVIGLMMIWPNIVGHPGDRVHVRRSDGAVAARLEEVGRDHGPHAVRQRAAELEDVHGLQGPQRLGAPLAARAPILEVGLLDRAGQEASVSFDDMLLLLCCCCGDARCGWPATGP